ncbi:MAG: hypothetical protein EOP22_14235 [Hyphomicrobiales bacterium]|nr:MAG: hypothetical protein EOP22_14235 [Hyphomicrobiales bacterium]
MHRTGYALFALALIAVAMPGSALGGDGNEAYFIQASPDGSTFGNTLTIKQDEANYSLVTGINRNLVGALPAWVVRSVGGVNPLNASQRGEGNSATLTFEGDGGELQLLQASARNAAWVPGFAGGNNSAIVTSLGDSLGGVIQVGADNEAIMRLDNGRGLITQLGNNLFAQLTVAPSGSGTIVQIGNNSSAGAVTVLGGTTLLYTQIGNNLTQSAAVEAFSTAPGTIVITQTAW